MSQITLLHLLRASMHHIIICKQGNLMSADVGCLPVPWGLSQFYQATVEPVTYQHVSVWLQGHAA